jgi:serine/threonine-protein kinase
MGEVYLARDTKLGREVAIKVLPAAFAENKERLARFEREARLLASLNHPNIATIHGLEETDGVHFLVLEYVPGETLADRIERGAIPIDEALPLFKQIAEALEAAHENGIIHRDLKPANIKVTPEGKVKVLDFGLAKALAAETPAQDLSESPTLTKDATETGILLGTAPYMSPEQARGKTVDKRTDIWAFGCVLYESLAGQKAFLGVTVADTIAVIVKTDPNWDNLPEAVPWRARELMRRCLQKDASLRLRDIGDARIEILEAIDPLSGTPTAAPVSDAGIRTFARKHVLLIAGLAALVAGTVGYQLQRFGPSSPPPVRRLAVTLPSSQQLVPGPGPSVALSPDGKTLVYLATEEGTRRLYSRKMDEPQAEAILGTEGAIRPFFSHDGQWVGFVARGKLRKVSMTGGPTHDICDIQRAGYGASWLADDTILVAASEREGLSRVSAAGGDVEILTAPVVEDGEIGHYWPAGLPGGKAVLFTIWTGSPYDNSRIAVLSLETRKWHVLIEGGSCARYVPTGHLVYVRGGRGGTILAVPFDLNRLEVTGSPVPIVEDVQVNAQGIAHFDFSHDGTLVHTNWMMGLSELVWVDRQGGTQPVTDVERNYAHPRLSPDGQRLAMTIFADDATYDIWTYDLARGTLARETFGLATAPVWSLEGNWLVFGDDSEPLSRKRVGISGGPERLTEQGFPTSLSPDGDVMAFMWRGDIWILAMEKEAEPQRFLESPFNETQPVFSPNGRWIAYTSDESGRNEVYVRAFPGPGEQIQISTDGGSQPVWARNGREIFYRNGTEMVAVEIEIGATFRAGSPEVLFQFPFIDSWPNVQGYDVTANGRRFITVRGVDSTEGRQINVTLNWYDELKRLVLNR